MRSNWTSPKNIVVKVGSAVIARGGTLEPAAIRRLVDDLSTILDADAARRVVLVSSGAVASGFRSLGLDNPPKTIVGKQAAAAIGQPRLMSAYAEAFAARAARAGSPQRWVGQVLLTAEDIDHRKRFVNARSTINAMLDARVIPIINENDSVSFDEIKLGDNDHLAAMVAGLVGADLLVILSSVAGVWDADGAAVAAKGGTPRIVPEIRSLAEGLKLVAPTKTSTGVGGMATKVKAACTAAALGASTVIADGRVAGIVARVVDGESVGTLFPRGGALRVSAARKKWIGFSARPKGCICVDEGARKAIVTRGASLLPGGIREVRGDFDIGALVEVLDAEGVAIARGLASYGAEELRRIQGLKSRQIEPTLGYCYCDEAVHRSAMVLMDASHAPALSKGARRG